MPTRTSNKGPFRRGKDPWRFISLFLAAVGFAVPALAQDEDGPVGWSGSISARALSRLSQYGLDAAPERVTFVAGGSITHASGVGLTLSTAVQPGPWAVQRSSLSGEYEVQLSDPWTLGIAVTRTWYPSGSTNPLASSPTSAGMTLAFDADPWSFGADLERYIGGEGATYLSFDASVFIGGDGFSLLPIVSCSFGSQTVAAGSLKRGKGRSVGLATTTVTGLSSIDGMVVLIAPLGNGWSASVMPGLMYTPSDLASATTRFTWSVGVRKAL